MDCPMITYTCTYIIKKNKKLNPLKNCSARILERMKKDQGKRVNYKYKIRENR